MLLRSMSIRVHESAVSAPDLTPKCNRPAEAGLWEHEYNRVVTYQVPEYVPVHEVVVVARVVPEHLNVAPFASRA